MAPGQGSEPGSEPELAPTTGTGCGWLALMLAFYLPLHVTSMIVVLGALGPGSDAVTMAVFASSVLASWFVAYQAVRAVRWLVRARSSG